MRFSVYSGFECLKPRKSDQLSVGRLVRAVYYQILYLFVSLSTTLGVVILSNYHYYLESGTYQYIASLNAI